MTSVGPAAGTDAGRTPDADAGVVRVVLVDDQAVVRGGLRLILESQPDIVVVGEAADGRAGIDLVRSEQPDVVLMDIRMPVLDGIAATAELVADDPTTRVLILTTYAADENVYEALRAGAVGFFAKTDEPAVLVADAYFAAAKVIGPLLGAGWHLIAAVRSNAVAYRAPEPPKPGTRGRRRTYGEKVTLKRLFEDQSAFAEAPSPVYGESGVTLRFLTLGADRWTTARRCGAWIEVALAAQAREEGWDRGSLARRVERRRFLVNAYLRGVQRVAQFRVYQRLFSWWHVLHVPLVWMLVATTIAHVVAVHMY